MHGPRLNHARTAPPVPGKNWGGKHGQCLFVAMAMSMLDYQREIPWTSSAPSFQHLASWCSICSSLDLGPQRPGTWHGNICYGNLWHMDAYEFVYDNHVIGNKLQIIPYLEPFSLSMLVITQLAFTWILSLACNGRFCKIVMLTSGTAATELALLFLGPGGADGTAWLAKMTNIPHGSHKTRKTCLSKLLKHKQTCMQPDWLYDITSNNNII